MPNSLSQLLIDLTVNAVRVSGDAELNGITADSREVQAGDLFICMPSANRDTHDFLEAVKEKGAAAAYVHSEAGLARAERLGLPAAFFRPEPRQFFRAASESAHRLMGQPTRSLRVIGITGTNGKTTTAWIIADALRALGLKTGYLGTLGLDMGEGARELANTTPFPVESAKLIGEVRDAGCSCLTMEVSSHALAEDRLAGAVFDAAVFTNLTQDHLDFHETMDAYAAAKWRLFTDWADDSRRAGKPFVAAINSDDPVGHDWLARLSGRVISYGENGGDLRIEAMDVRVDGLHLKVRYLGDEADLRMRLGGLFNVQNAGSALAGLLGMGVSLGDACAALAEARQVPGRFESIENDYGFGVIVDYAHTPDALVQLLKSARALEPNRIITVFGCGGDRDRNKRPKMATAVSQMSDIAVVTSDNPRTEDPAQILKDVEAGIKPGTKSVSIIDRPKAILWAVNEAQPGDIVVIAGKGHEDYQIIGREKIHMDDREMARDALEARAGG